MRNALSQRFNNRFGANFYSIFKSHFEEYATSMTKNIEYLYNYLFLLADYIKKEVSVASASRLLRPTDDRYLTRLIASKKFKSYDAFFGFLIETLFMTEVKTLFNDPTKISEFKEKFLDISFEYGKGVVFDNDHILEGQFDALVYSLYAFNKLGMTEPVNPNNPIGLYLLSHLSRDYSDSRNEQMIRQQLAKGLATYQIFEIKRTLERNQLSSQVRKISTRFYQFGRQASEAITLAIDRCNNYADLLFSDKSVRRASIGTLVHKPLEIIIYKILKLKGLISGMETKVIPGRYFAVDQSIVKNDLFLSSIDLSFLKKIIQRNIRYHSLSLSVDEVLSNIQHFVIDYTISSSLKVSVGTIKKPGKVRKPGYYSEHQFLFIVNYDPSLDNHKYYDNRMRDKMILDGIPHPEMVSFIGVEDLVDLLLKEGDEKDEKYGKLLIELNNLLTLVELAKKRKSKFDELIRLYDKASDEFDRLKLSGIIGGYIGDLV